MFQQQNLAASYRTITSGHWQTVVPPDAPAAEHSAPADLARGGPAHCLALDVSRPFSPTYPSTLEYPRKHCCESSRTLSRTTWSWRRHSCGPAALLTDSDASARCFGKGK